MKVIQFTIPVAKDEIVCVQEDILPHFYNHLHRHNEAQLTWIIKGNGSLIAGNYMQSFKDGDVYFIGANQPHLLKSDPTYFDKGNKLQVHALTLYFNPVGLFQPFLNITEMSKITKFLAQSNFGLQLPAPFLDKIVYHLTAVKNAQKALRMAAFIRLIQTMSDIEGWKTLSSVAAEDTFSDVEGLRMNEVYQYTMNNFSKDIQLQQIASIAHMTPQGFCRYFKMHTRKTYFNFLNEIRIGEACKLLVGNRTASISTVAEQVGFNNAVSFNRVFKKITGTAPRKYIENFDRQKHQKH